MRLMSGDGMTVKCPPTQQGVHPCWVKLLEDKK